MQMFLHVSENHTNVSKFDVICKVLKFKFEKVVILKINSVTT